MSHLPRHTGRKPSRRIDTAKLAAAAVTSSAAFVLAFSGPGSPCNNYPLHSGATCTHSYYHSNYSAISGDSLDWGTGVCVGVTAFVSVCTAPSYHPGPNVAQCIAPLCAIDYPGTSFVHNHGGGINGGFDYFSLFIHGLG